MHRQKRKLSSRIFKWLEEALNYLLFLLNHFPRKPSGSSTPPKIVLITKLDSIGDFVLFSGCLVGYRNLFPNSWLVLLVKDNVYNLAETCPYVDEVWCLPCRKFRLNVFERLRWYRKISATGFDLAVNAVFSCSFSFLDCLVGWTGAPRRIAFQSETTEWVFGRQRQYFTEFVFAEESARFEIDRNHDMLRHLGYEGTSSHKTEVWITECDRKVFRHHCQGVTEKAYAVLFPGAMMKSRRWPADNFVTALKEITSLRPLYWVICGSADEAELCGYISSILSKGSIPNADLSGKTSLRELAALMEGALFYLGNETSGAHIAAAVETPAICILGGGHPWRFFPYPDNALTIAVTHKLPCYNCDWQCLRPSTECISEITVADVVGEAVKLIRQ